LIASYNEKPRLNSVLTELFRVPEIDEIVVVDDGSHDGTASFLQKKFPDSICVRLKNNRGKSAAILAGIQKARGENILLFDADIRHLIPSEISSAIRAWNQASGHRMLILSRTHAPIVSRLLRWNIIFSGERILRTKDLREVFRSRVLHNFQIEIAINHFIMRHSGRCGHFPYSGENSYGWHKHTFGYFLKKYWQMSFQIVAAYGVQEYMRQMCCFAKTQLTEL